MGQRGENTASALQRGENTASALQRGENTASALQRGENTAGLEGSAAAKRQQQSPPLKLQRHSRYGVCAVATAEVPQGFTLWREHPVLTATHPPHSSRLRAQLSAFKALERGDRTVFLQRFFAPRCDGRLGQLAAIAAAEHGEGSAEELQALRAWQTNAHTLSPESTGMLEIGCLFAHSCCPNLVACPGMDGSVGFNTARPIRRGEQLTASYLGLHTLSGLKYRQAKLAAQYQFDCLCPRCSKELWEPHKPEQECERAVIEMVAGLERSGNQELDAMQLLELEQECLECCGLGHWSSQMVGLILCEALAGLVQGHPKHQGLGSLLSRLRVLAEALVEQGQDPGYFLGEMAIQGLESAKGSSEELLWTELIQLFGLSVQLSNESLGYLSPHIVSSLRAQLDGLRGTAECLNHCGQGVEGSISIAHGCADEGRQKKRCIQMHHD